MTRFSARCRLVLTLALLVAFGVGCAGASPVTSNPPGRDIAAPSQTAAPKRLTAAIQGDPHTVFELFNPSGTVKGIAALEHLVHADLYREDTAGAMHPVLADAIPTAENGLWSLLPDGRMETTWRIRDNARWHDGQPVTAGDFLFATTLGRDKELPAFGTATYELVESVAAPDARTFVVTWKKPYIRADRGLAVPLPRHILEPTYLEDKTRLEGLPYFLHEWVGAGPFKLREVVRGSHLIVDANPDYVLGRPKIDVIEVKFIQDVNTILARLLSGDVEMFMERGISLDQALQIKDRWTTGSIKMGIASLAEVWPQLLNPTPAVISNVEFRRALLHALDRQEMVETMQGGLVPIAHSIVNPTEAEYKEIERSIVKYDYDPRRAEQLISNLGYVKASDGVFRDGSGQPLSVKIEATSTDINVRTMLATADYWKRLGIDVETETISPQAQTDLALRSSFPGFSTNRIGGPTDFLTTFHSREARVAENRYRGTNRPRYMNPIYDDLADRYAVTISYSERMEVARQLAHIISDQVVFLPLFHDPQPLLVSNRLRNVFPRESHRFETWNSEQWELVD
jgi:peptide/nickel transport system substrate-binding protein